MVGQRLRAAQRVAERLRGAAEQFPFETGSTPRIGLTVSIGLSFWLDSEALELALRRADDALYGAKAAGRNRVRVAAEQGA